VTGAGGWGVGAGSGSGFEGGGIVVPAINSSMEGAGLAVRFMSFFLVLIAD
jgi:hypothetical protein